MTRSTASRTLAILFVGAAISSGVLAAPTSLAGHGSLSVRQSPEFATLQRRGDDHANIGPRRNGIDLTFELSNQDGEHGKDPNSSVFDTLEDRADLSERSLPPTAAQLKLRARTSHCQLDDDAQAIEAMREAYSTARQKERNIRSDIAALGQIKQRALLALNSMNMNPSASTEKRPVATSNNLQAGSLISLLELKRNDLQKKAQVGSGPREA
ncbi:hypothetical protein EV361DRAFT_380552 [Lentinula raphanica]|nr:hypothetical protein EV361DRAFT_380552 [Lentinula raphanica]